MQSYGANESDSETSATISSINYSSYSAYNATISSAIIPIRSTSNSGYTLGRIILIIIGVTGLLANGVVQAVYILDEKLRKGTNNLLLRNQTMMDSIACIFLLSTMTILLKGTTASTPAGRWALCWVFESYATFTGTIYAANFGLVVIAFERYVKIVHPVSHRIRFRPWMIKVAMVLPWIYALVVFWIPVWSVLKPDLCVQQWPSVTFLKTFVIFSCVCQIIIPTTVFITCYSKIAKVIIGQKRVTFQHTMPPSNSTPPLPDQGKRVVKTMIVISVCFLLCWSPVQLMSILLAFGYDTLFNQTIFYLTAIAYFNVILNPVIYSAHLDVVGRIRCFVQRGFHGSQGSTSGSSYNPNTSNQTAGAVTANQKSETVEL